MYKTWAGFLLQEGPLRESVAAHCSVLAWSVSCTEEPDRLWSIGAQSRTRLKLLVTHTWLAKCCWLGASAGGRAHRQLAAREGTPHRLASAPFSASSGPRGPRFNSGPGLWATPALTGPCAYLLIQC